MGSAHCQEEEEEEVFITSGNWRGSAVPLSHGAHVPMFCPEFLIHCVQNGQDFSTARQLSPADALSPLPLLFLPLPRCLYPRVLALFVFLVFLNLCVALYLFFQDERFRSITFSRFHA